MKKIITWISNQYNMLESDYIRGIAVGYTIGILAAGIAVTLFLI